MTIVIIIIPVADWWLRVEWSLRSEFTKIMIGHKLFSTFRAHCSNSM